MICDSRGSPSGPKKAMGMKPLVGDPSGDPISLREYSDLFSYSVMEDPSGSNLVALIENISRASYLSCASEHDILWFAKKLIDWDNQMARSSVLTNHHRNSIRSFLSSSVQKLVDTPIELSSIAKLIVRDHLIPQYRNNRDEDPLAPLIPELSELDTAISSSLLDHFLTLHDTSSITNYLNFLSWVCEKVNVNYLTWVPPLLPKFFNTGCVDSATRLCLSLYVSNPVVAHLVSETVPDSADYITAFLSDKKLEKTELIGKLVKPIHHFPFAPTLLELIDTEFIHSQDSEIRKQTLISIVHSCGIRSDGPEFVWLIGRLMDRDASVRKIVWDFVAGLPKISDSICAILILLAHACKHQEVYIDLDEMFRILVIGYDGYSIEILKLLFETSCDKSRNFLREYFGSKNEARRIVKSIAFVIASEDQTNSRVKIEKQRAIRMCVRWASRSSISEKSVRKLFACLNVDLIELLMKLYSPTSLVWPTKLNLLSELQSLVPPEWYSLFAHSVNLFLDKKSMDLIVTDPDYEHMVTELMMEQYREELEEPGLINWSKVVDQIDCLRKRGQNFESLVKFFGKITRSMEPNGDSTHDTDDCVEQLLDHIVHLQISADGKISKNLLRGLLWYDFETCVNMIRGNSKLAECAMVASEIAMFVKRNKPDRVEEILSLLPINSSARRICDISSSCQNGNEEIFGVLINLIRACELHADCPPTALVDLALGLRSCVPLSNGIVKKLEKIVTPKNNPSDIIAFCGGIRIDFVPLMFLCGYGSAKWFKLFSKPTWSNSSRRIVEYLVALFVFIGVHLEGNLTSSVTSFITNMLRTTYASSRDSVAATIAATLDQLNTLEPKSNLVTMTTVEKFCTLVRGCLEEVHPSIIRLVLGNSYTLSVALAMFSSSPLGNAIPANDDEEKDALILKRKRVL